MANLSISDVNIVDYNLTLNANKGYAQQDLAEQDPAIVLLSPSFSREFKFWDDFFSAKLELAGDIYYDNHTQWGTTLATSGKGNLDKGTNWLLRYPDAAKQAIKGDEALSGWGINKAAVRFSIPSWGFQLVGGHYPIESDGFIYKYNHTLAYRGGDATRGGPTDSNSGTDTYPDRFSTAGALAETFPVWGSPQVSFVVGGANPDKPHSLDTLFKSGQIYWSPDFSLMGETLTLGLGAYYSSKEPVEKTDGAGRSVKPTETWGGMVTGDLKDYGRLSVGFSTAISKFEGPGSTTTEKSGLNVSTSFPLDKATDLTLAYTSLEVSDRSGGLVTSTHEEGYELGLNRYFLTAKTLADGEEYGPGEGPLGITLRLGAQLVTVDKENLPDESVGNRGEASAGLIITY